MTAAEPVGLPTYRRQELDRLRIVAASECGQPFASWNTNLAAHHRVRALALRGTASRRAHPSLSIGAIAADERHHRERVVECVVAVVRARLPLVGDVLPAIADVLPEQHQAPQQSRA